MRRGVSVKLFLVDGTPEGLRLVEKSNWTGIGLMCSRAQFADAQKRPEFDRPCVYVLLGPNESDGQPRIYIGEADLGRLRISQHAKNFDFWTHLILFTSKDSNLNKAHVKYIESQLVGLAQKAKRAHLENKNQPPSPQLAESDIADVESFLDDMLTLYPLLGLSAFEVVKSAGDMGTAPGRVLFLVGKGAKATGRETPEGVVVLAGSQARLDEVDSIHSFGSNIRATLTESGVLRVEAGHLVFTQDYTFASPSTAAMVLLGRTANGRIEWKTEAGKTLKAVQDETLSES
jgi:hypothetical protein